MTFFKNKLKILHFSIHLYIIYGIACKYREFQNV